MLYWKTFPKFLLIGLSILLLTYSVSQTGLGNLLKKGAEQVLAQEDSSTTYYADNPIDYPEAPQDAPIYSDAGTNSNSDSSSADTQPTSTTYYADDPIDYNQAPQDAPIYDAPQAPDNSSASSTTYYADNPIDYGQAPQDAPIFSDTPSDASSTTYYAGSPIDYPNQAQTTQPQPVGQDIFVGEICSNQPGMKVDQYRNTVTGNTYTTHPHLVLGSCGDVQQVSRPVAAPAPVTSVSRPTTVITQPTPIVSQPQGQFIKVDEICSNQPGMKVDLYRHTVTGQTYTTHPHLVPGTCGDVITSTPTTITSTPTSISTPASSQTSFGNLDVVCSVFPGTVINQGDAITFTANVVGGSGNFEYKWSGPSEVSSMRTSSVSTNFNSTGTKRASVEVRDRQTGKRVSDNCPAVTVQRNQNNVVNNPTNNPTVVNNPSIPVVNQPSTSNLVQSDVCPPGTLLRTDGALSCVRVQGANPAPVATNQGTSNPAGSSGGNNTSINFNPTFNPTFNPNNNVSVSTGSNSNDSSATNNNSPGGTTINITTSANNPASGATTTLAPADQKVVYTTPVAITQQPVSTKELPRTGLPIAGFGLASLFPIGLKIRKLGQKSQEALSASSIWAQRQLKLS